MVSPSVQVGMAPMQGTEVVMTSAGPVSSMPVMATMAPTSSVQGGHGMHVAPGTQVVQTISPQQPMYQMAHTQVPPSAYQQHIPMSSSSPQFAMPPPQQQQQQLYATQAAPQYGTYQQTYMQPQQQFIQQQGGYAPAAGY
jgi:hypothetical protein